MKNQLYSLTIISIIILFCSSCSITRQTTCPTFENKTSKVQKPLFSKKTSSKKKQQQLVKITDQTKKEKKKHSSLDRIENFLSKIEIQDLTVSSDNEIELNSTNIAPSFVETKIRKIIIKKIEKKSKKILKTLEKHNQKGAIKENYEPIISSKKKHKKKRKKPFNSKNNDPTDEREVHDLAIMSLMAGLSIYLSLLLIPFIYGGVTILIILLAILAVVWGIKGKKQIKKNPSKYKGRNMAQAGLVLGLIVFCVMLLIIAFYIYFFLTYDFM